MRDLALQAAGALAILVAIAHGAIAELRVFAKAHIEPQGTRNLLRGVWQASTVDWIAIGLLLIAAPSFGSQTARQWIIRWLLSSTATPPSAMLCSRAGGTLGGA